MKLTFLGTGTSVGVPAIGCDCTVCTSDDPRNQRRRTSIYLESRTRKVLVDTPPDFREQALTFNVRHIDAVLFTHFHADHVFGFDDIRRFNSIQGQIIPAYGSPSVVADLKRVFTYIGADHVPGVFRPRIEYRETNEDEFAVGDMHVQALPVVHGSMPTHGYVVRSEGRSIGYFPDCHRMSDEVVAALRGVDVMVLDALRHEPHSTHLTVAESVGLLQRIGAPRSFITHLCHDLDHHETQRALPETMFVAYDGLELAW